MSLLDASDRIPQPAAGKLLDYVLEPYEPVAKREGRLHSLSALRFFLRSHGWLDPLLAPIAALRATLGPDETVWGVKVLPDGQPGIELYFYNHCRNASGSPKSVTRLAKVLAPWIEVDAQIDERMPYLMCSLEIDSAVLRDRRSPGFRIYFAGTRPKEGYDGVSFLASAGRLRTENFYSFYRADAEMSLVRDRVRASLRAGDPAQRERLLDPRMLDCFTVCFAHKAETDALYFSRVRLDQALPVLAERMPGALTEMLGAHTREFGHLRWDIGYDFSSPATDSMQSEIRKVGLYGFF